jgi:hypothetical protein
MISYQRLREVLEYNKNTGVFRWKIPRGNKKHLPGEVAGAARGIDDYVKIGIDGNRYYAHQLAWFYVHGVWVKGLDHIDLNKGNNRIDNLRQATATQQCANVKVKASNKLGVKGVRRRTKSCYEVRIRIGGRRYQKYFKTSEEAHAAYSSMLRDAHGEFARG